MFADLFLIEMFQTTVAWIMKKYHDEHDFCLWQGWNTVIFTLCNWFKRVFCHHGIKKLAEISAMQNNSITLLSVIIAIIVRNSFFFSTIKIRQFSLITNFISIYNSSNSRYKIKNTELSLNPVFPIYTKYFIVPALLIQYSLLYECAPFSLQEATMRARRTSHGRPVELL